MQFLGVFSNQPFLSALCNSSVSSKNPIISPNLQQQAPVKEEHVYTAPDGKHYTLKGELVDPERRRNKTPSRDKRADLPAKRTDLDLKEGSIGVSTEFLKKFITKVRPGMTTSDVCKNIVLPQTKQKLCSFTSLLLSEPDALGVANVFVSHAWAYDFVTCIQVLLDYAAERPSEQCYFWFDLFANNQWETQAMPQEYYATTFKNNIKNIGRVVLVLSPWEAPQPLTRAWCLWEIMCTIDAGAELVVRLPKGQQGTFEKTLLSDSTKIIAAMSKVAAQNAEAFFARDKEMIFGAITAGVGFSILNQRVKEKMRAWLTESAEDILRRAGREGKTGRAMAAVQQEIGSLLTQLGSLQRAEELLIKAVNFYKFEVNVAGGGGAVAARAFRLLGLCCRDKGDLVTAKEYLERALELYGEDTHHDLDVASCLEAVGAVVRSEANYTKAFELYKKSLDLRLRCLGPNHVDTAASYDGMGGTCRMKGEFADAVKYYKQGLTIRKALMGDRHPDVGASLNNLGNACFNLGEYNEALSYYSQCLTIFLEAFGEQHLNTSGCYNNIANVHQALGDYQAASTNCRKCLELSRRMFGEKSTHTAQAWSNLGGLLTVMEQYEEAETAFETALSIGTESVGNEHPLIGDILGGLGDVLAHRGQHERALHQIKRSLQVRIKVLGENHPSTAASHEAIGQLYVQMHEPEKAREAFAASVKAKTHSLGANHPKTLAAIALERNAAPQPTRAFEPKQQQIARHGGGRNNVRAFQPTVTNKLALQPAFTTHESTPEPPAPSLAFQPHEEQMLSTESSHSAHAFQFSSSNVGGFEALHSLEEPEEEVRPRRRGRSPRAFESRQQQMEAKESLHAPSAPAEESHDLAHALQLVQSQMSGIESVHAFESSKVQMLGSSSVHAFQPSMSQTKSDRSVHAFQPTMSQTKSDRSVHAFQPTMSQSRGDQAVHAFQPSMSQSRGDQAVHAFQPSLKQTIAFEPAHAFQPSVAQPSISSSNFPKAESAFQPQIIEPRGYRSRHAFNPQVSQMVSSAGVDRSAERGDQPAVLRPPRAFAASMTNAIRSV